MSRREIGCSSRGTILGSPIRGIVPNAETQLLKPLTYNRLGRGSVWYDRNLRSSSMQRSRTLNPTTTRTRRAVESVCCAVVVTCTWLVNASGSSVHAGDDPLTRARLLYNQRQFQDAVVAAELARRTPARADAADLVAARAYL